MANSEATIPGSEEPVYNEAKFTLMAVVTGICQNSGFRVSKHPDFTDGESVGVVQRLCVSIVKQ